MYINSLPRCNYNKDWSNTFVCFPYQSFAQFSKFTELLRNQQYSDNKKFANHWDKICSSSLAFIMFMYSWLSLGVMRSELQTHAALTTSRSYNKCCLHNGKSSCNLTRLKPNTTSMPVYPDTFNLIKAFNLFFCSNRFLLQKKSPIAMVTFPWEPPGMNFSTSCSVSELLPLLLSDSPRNWRSRLSRTPQITLSLFAAYTAAPHFSHSAPNTSPVKK